MLETIKRFVRWILDYVDLIAAFGAGVIVALIFAYLFWRKKLKSGGEELEYAEEMGAESDKA